MSKCVYYDMCDMNIHCGEEDCPYYKSKSLFVELPCKVGETLYFLYNRPYADKPDLTPKIYETNEWYFEVDKKRIDICPSMIHGYNGEYFYHLGKTVFLTKEEAERKLSEVGK